MTALPNGSASASDRTCACPASLALPRVCRTSEYAEAGHGKHRFVKDVLMGIPVDRALERVEPEHRETCQKLEWQRLGADLSEIRPEVSYALDPVARTARFLGIDIDRDYGRFDLGPDEIPGSLDIEGVRLDGMPVVLDLKSGYLSVADAEENGQGLFFGAVKHILLGAPEVEFRVARIAPSGTVRIESSATYTALDIDLYLDRYAEALERSREARRVYLAGGVPDVYDGPWCRFCEAAEACPSKVAFARAMVTTASDLVARVTSMPLAEVGEAFLKWDQVRGMVKVIGEALKARARLEHIPTTEGRVARLVEYAVPSFNQTKALDLLRELGATDEQIGALYGTNRVEKLMETKDPKAPRVRKVRKKDRAA